MKRIVSLLLVAVLFSTFLTGCELEQLLDFRSQNETADTDESQETTEDGPFANGLSAEKIGSIKVDSITATDGGIYYLGENDKYGVMSFDGIYDTGAIYTDCEPEGEYFIVTSKGEPTSLDASELNVHGVIDAKGNRIVPEEYASIEQLNERYIKVCEVIEETDVEDDALVYFTDDMFSFSPDDDDILFTGNWYVYDITTQSKVSGISGTKAYRTSAAGNYITYYTDFEEERCVNDKGQALPEGADLFDDGSYAIEKTSEGTVYNTNGSILFTYDPEGFSPYTLSDEYYIASQYADGKSKYVLLNKNGEIVSAEFSASPSIYGELLLVDHNVVDFDGNSVIEGYYEYVQFDRTLKNHWMLENDGVKTIIDREGAVLYQAKEDDSLWFDMSYFTVRNEIEDKTVYYSFKDQDFTLEGVGFGPWTVRVSKPNYIYDIVDTISGKTLIEGYDNYTHTVTEDGTFYAYAQKAEGGMDVYIIK